MKEIIVSALCAGGKDYSEADRLVRLITAEMGVVTALMRGVKKQKAKLKYAAMPFSFCNYTLSRRGDFYTVIGAEPIESLFDIAYEPDNYIIGSLMLEAAAVAVGGQKSPQIFLYLLSGLKMLLYSDTDAYSIALNFFCYILKNGGHYIITVSDESYCGDISSQVSLEQSRAAVKLKSFIRIFESKYHCKLNSAAIL